MAKASGSGVPLWFKCPVQRREDAWAWPARSDRRHDQTRTGRTKPPPNPNRGNPRKLRESHEFVCSCGHVGWSCHVDILHKPLDPTEV